jgi:hypothetical protein
MCFEIPPEDETTEFDAPQDVNDSKRPMSISAIVASRGKHTKISTKTAREMIYSNSGVGVDLRASRSDVTSGPDDSARPQPPRPEPTLPDTLPMFLKPSGVDDPAESNKPVTSTAQGITSDKGSNIVVKRERDLASDRTLLEGKKRKKKKHKTE